MGKRIMRAFKMNEISAVDRPAQAGAKMVLMKRAEGAPTVMAEDADFIFACDLFAKFGAHELTVTKEPKPYNGVLVTKDLYDVSRFAEILQSIYYLSQSAAYEAESEKDGSRVPAALKSWLSTGTTVFRAMADEEINELVATLTKRDFSAKERKKDAKSGAAMPDGSFPIENAKDLANARKLVGHAKDPAAARRHIEARAKALGLSKGDESMLGKAIKFVKSFGSANASLAASIKSIVDDPAATDKGALIDETIKQFSDHVEGEIEKTLSGGQPVISAEDEMSVALKKALGLSETATEAEMIAAVEISKAGMSDVEKTYHDALKTPDEQRAFRALSKADRAVKMAPAAPTVAPEVQKALDENADLKKRLAVLEDERALAKFVIEAVDLGIPASKAEILMKADRGDKEAVGELKQLLKAAYAAAEAGAVFKEFGGSGRGVDANDPNAAIWAKADELRKTQPELSREQAFAKVYADPANKELAKRERRENRPRAA